ncbi:MAG TPA: sporulation-delaying protein SdpB family protein [Chitinophaga sp.]|uniref:sporulation-delaying protein SdpB family protein n=1 Tax=Chitinophaga sp. TaxID=1869181 RepID=UPI002BEC4161|nr:sporulation-delaying protein SdpB family protein [Chitinophaga sp.]HVI47777.1 sporulation-delaying protein SdpB family protein [Chitinophaga sp.]
MPIRFFQQKINALNAYADTLANRNIYASNALGFARTILATGTLLTFLFSPYDAVFVDGINKVAFVDSFNAFNLFELIKSPIAARAVAAVILITVISGYLPQITGILHWWVCFSMFNKGTLVDGGDQVSMILSGFLLPVTLLDPRLNHWTEGKTYNRPYSNILSNVVLGLIAVQMSVIYFHSAVEKMKVAEWVNGTAVYYFLNNNLFGPVPVIRNLIVTLMASPLIALLADWGVLLLEILLFAALFMSRKNKRRMLIAGVAFHFTIIIMHGLVSFFFAMTAGLFLYLYPLDQSVALRILPFKKLRRKQPSAAPSGKLQTI